MAGRLLEGRLVRLLYAVAMLLTPLVLWFIPIPPGKLHWSLCIYKNITGNNCYGCGITRAVLSVIHFKFSQAMAFNKMVIVVFPLLCYIWLKGVVTAWHKYLLQASTA